MTDKKTGLDLLREPFPDHQVSKKPQGTKAQNDCPANEKRNCAECGGWHHPKVIHLDYVGHAALTDRLLDADPNWTWEPLALRDGLPAFDATGGLWIRLTVCGVTRLGYGHAAASSFKEVGSREKEVIGDALRNAAMRFGAALELWHKGDLHLHDDMPKEPPETLEWPLYVPNNLQPYSEHTTLAEWGCAAESMVNLIKSSTKLDDEAKKNKISELLVANKPTIDKMEQEQKAMAAQIISFD